MPQCTFMRVTQINTVTSRSHFHTEVRECGILDFDPFHMFVNYRNFKLGLKCSLSEGRN